VVEAVGEVRTAAGRQFNTVRYRIVSRIGSSVDVSRTWISMEDNIVVRQETLDGAGNVTTVTERTQ
jgi:hypothetical protein